MTTTRSIAVACGLAGLLGLGALAVSRAQQVEPKGEARVPPRKALRDRVVKLRTEVDLQQLEFDAERSDLLDEMKASYQQAQSIQSETQALALQAFMAASIGGDEEAKKAIDQGDDAIKKLAKERLVKARATFDRKKASFAQHAAMLHEKKLDLEEAEIRYREVR